MFAPIRLAHSFSAINPILFVNVHIHEIILVTIFYILANEVRLMYIIHKFLHYMQYVTDIKRKTFLVVRIVHRIFGSLNNKIHTTNLNNRKYEEGEISMLQAN